MPAKRSNQPSFMAAQAAFTAWIRNPKDSPLPPNCSAERMAIYRRLFYNNMESMVARTFPITKKILTNEGWHALFGQFFAEHLCESPYFRDIPEAFFSWLQPQPLPEDKPWLLELAHYEWVELVLETSDAVPPSPTGDILTHRPTISPLALPLAYTWPVHRISPDFQPTEAPPALTFLLVWRDAAGKVRFMELPAPVAHLLHVIATTQPPSGEAAVQAVGGEAPSLRTALQELADKGICLPVAD
jgi:hypothetical protein